MKIDLIGKYFKADHPITCMNPREYNKIVDVKVDWCTHRERIHVLVRGEDTMWFSDTCIAIILEDIDHL